MTSVSKIGLLILYGTSAVAQIIVTPAKLPKIATVSDRFLSYNIEMVEVTGGRFWKPYKAVASARPATTPQTGTPAGLSPDLFEYRPPVDLTNRRLRRLAAALGPAYVRVSGTWANTTYFHDSDETPPKTPPNGFSGVLTRAQWKAVVEFANSVNAGIVTSFAISPGTRDAGGLWTTKQAAQLIAFTKQSGGKIAAAEFMNEPTFAGIGGAPEGYDAPAYARDVAVFRPFLKAASPGTVFLGPGSVGEGGALASASRLGTISTEDILKATGDVFDAFSYHLYGAVSKRCSGTGPESMQMTPADALSAEWLSRNDKITSFYAALRDRFEPGKPMWLTETADAACGGNPWGATFLDTFRYLDQHGRLAKRGVQVIAHNTLAASDYGILDESTFEPRPNYWGALLWKRLMGSTVLDAGTSNASNVSIYAHCLRGRSGGVALLAVNADRTASAELRLPVESERYTLTAKDLEGGAVQLNGTTLGLGPNDTLPGLQGVHVKAGAVALSPVSITFFAIANAGNRSCR